MKVRLQMMIQDPRFAPVQGAKRRIEGYDVTNEQFSNGPATERVVVVDRDAGTGQVVAGATFLAAEGRRVLGKFDLPTPKNIDVESRTFNQVSVMATVLKTIALYEDSDVLGRPIRWNFDEPKLTVIPRMGQEENAYYRRDLKRLEFYYFRGRVDSSQIVYTSLSRDIVGHETGHAILDGIAPHLLSRETATSHSRGLHETIGDITGLLISIDSPNLRKEVLAKTNGSIEDPTNFSAFGEQWGMANGEGALRDLRNTKKMSDVGNEEHALSEVLSGALYEVLIKIHNKRWNAATKASDTAATRFSKSGKALWESAQQFKRMTLRALDYLPPGQIIFADYARAVIATDQASHPDDTEERSWLKHEFVRRGIVANEQALDMTVPDVNFGNIDLETLVKDDAAARIFVEQNRTLMRIPNGAAFKVSPRLDVTKKYYHRARGRNESKESEVRECLIKVHWTDPEDNQLIVGTTLAIDWKTRQLRVLLTSDHRDRPGEKLVQANARSDATNRAGSISCCK
jgi:hypothetical protein